MSTEALAGNAVIGKTRGGSDWTPLFVIDHDQDNCIGCGRCYKVCPREVFELVSRGESVSDDDDWMDSFEEMMVMSIADAMDCIGCQACSKVCPKNCYSHQAVA